MVISGSFTRDSRCLGEEFLGKNSGRFLRKKVCAAARWSVKSILRGAQLERELRLEGNCLELFLNKDNRRPLNDEKKERMHKCCKIKERYIKINRKMERQKY